MNQRSGFLVEEQQRSALEHAGLGQPQALQQLGARKRERLRRQPFPLARVLLEALEREGAQALDGNAGHRRAVPVAAELSEQER